MNVQIVSLNLIEYFFIKMGTIYDNCYEAFFFLFEPKIPNRKIKHKFLEDEFYKYNQETGDDLSMEWYSSVNNVRNRIVHGGYSVKTFIEDGRILFQVYNSNLDVQLNEDCGFFKNNSQLIYMDYYTNFYTRLAHWYMEHFFHFILHKLLASENRELNLIEEMHKQSSAVWLVGDEDLFNSISRSMNAP